VSWAYWLRDTIPGVTRVVTVDGARLFFPEERPAELVPHLVQHWADHARGPDRGAEDAPQTVLNKEPM
jgi:hypothetical protein